MSRYEFSGQTFDVAGDSGQLVLARAHGSGKRPLCLCVRPPVPMYVAKIDGRFYIKRMPNTGAKHSAACDSYDPPAALSGLGEVAGVAIQEDPDAGMTTLKLDFAMTKTGARAAPTASGAEAASVRTDGKKLTIRGLLHYLWDQAGFNRWTPAMEGRRSWPTIRKFVLQAAADKQSKGAALGDQLYMPEPYSPERKADIAARRRNALAPIAGSGSARKLMLAIGEVKEITEARVGHRIILKHLPDFAFLLNDDIYRRMNKRFGRELTAWSTLEDQGVRLMIVATFGLDAAGNASIDELALMTVTAQWLPFETRQDLELITALVDEKRKFSVGLRYNLPSDRPLATAVLSDTLPTPVTLYALPANMTSSERTLLSELVEEAQLPAWFWPHTASRPALPGLSGFVSMEVPEATEGEPSGNGEVSFIDEERP